MDSLEKRLVLNAYEGSDEPTDHERMVIGIGTKIALYEEMKRQNQKKSLFVQAKLEGATLQHEKLIQQIAILSQQIAILHAQSIGLQKEDFAIQNRLAELYASSCAYGIKQEAIVLKNSAKFICECNKINGIHFEDDHEPAYVVDISK